MLPPTLTVKCRISLQICFSLILSGVRGISSCLGAPCLVRGGGAGMKRFAGLLRFACTDFCISAGCRRKELNLVHENTCRRLHCPGIWGLFPAGFPRCLFVKEHREVLLAYFYLHLQGATPEDFSNLPPEQRRKKLQQKVDELNKEIQKEMDQR